MIGLVGTGEPVGLGEEREPRRREALGDRLGVGDGRPGVLLPEPLELQEGLAEGRDPVPVGVVEDPPDQGRVELLRTGPPYR